MQFFFFTYSPLQARHNGRDGVSTQQPHDCYSTVYSGTNQRKHQPAASLAFVRGIHRWPVNSPHKGPVTQKCFHLMTSSCYQQGAFLLCHIHIALLNLSSPQVNTSYCPACRTSLIATRFWVVVICPIIKCLTVLEFSFILFDLCLFITIFYFILNYVPIVTFWIFTYHEIWILLIIFCFIWNYWIIYFLTCLEVFWGVVS